MIEAEPDVFAHNLETVRRLHGRIRPAFGYDRSLEVLRIAKRLRAGTDHEVEPDPGDGRATRRGRAGAWPTSATPACDILTMGQYLQPTPTTCPSTAGSTPTSSLSTSGWVGQFGIAHVEAGPLVRSSYHAGKQLKRAVEAGVAAPV